MLGCPSAGLVLDDAVGAALSKTSRSNKDQWNICSLVEHADKTYERPQNSEVKCHG